MSDNNQDRSQDEGQQGIDRETEQRNRENETGQAGGQPQQESAFGQKGQSAGGDTNLADSSAQTGGQSSTGESSSGEGGFVGSVQDNSGDYLTKGEENQDFAAEGQGAQETSQGRTDVETGQSQDSGSDLDDGSDAGRSA